MSDFSLATAIAADPERVWAVVGDVARYPEWHPLVERMDVDSGRGTPLELVLRAGPRPRLRARLFEWEPAHLLSWDVSSRVRGLVRARYKLVIVAAEAGSTLVQAVQVAGLLPRLVPRRWLPLPGVLVATAQAVQRRVELPLGAPSQA